MSGEDKEFLAQCEELFKDRYTENDEDFMKVYNAEPSSPPIVESWWAPQNSGRRNDRRFNRHQPYERSNDRRSGYRNDDNRGQGYRNTRYY